MRLLIVIVNYRTPALTIECLRSLEPQVRALGEGAAKVVLTDNCSPDDSVAQLRSAIEANGWQGWIDFRPLQRNGGFAWGNNEAIRPYLDSAVKPQYVLLLNPDTVAREGAVAALLQFMEANPRVGIAGSRMENPDGSPQRSAFRYPRLLSEVEGSFRLSMVTKLLRKYIVAPPPPRETSPAEWVVGASMIIRREVFEAIGLLDDSYFMYFEEVDFCLRAKRAGWGCMYVADSHVVHLIGQSSGVTDAAQRAKRRPAYWFASRRRYFIKNHGVLYAALADFFWITGFSLWRLRRWVLRIPDPDPAHFLGDFIRNSIFFKGARLAPKAA